MRKGLSCAEAGKLGAEQSAKSLALRAAKRLEAYSSLPKKCKGCDEILSYKQRFNNFCSQSCAASFNNKGSRKHGSPPALCIHCGLINVRANRVYCSNPCQEAYMWAEHKKQMLSSGVDNSSANRHAKKYLIELHSGKCQICLEDTWCNAPMPLVLDHINGNPYDNSVANLRVICHNCDAQTPTFAGKNRGNGRVERAKRYQVEKEIFNAAKNADIVQK
jgi:hypothetical protein